MNDTQRLMARITSTDPLFWKNVKKIVKTVSNTTEFDKWLEKLVAKNGVTNY